MIVNHGVHVGTRPVDFAMDESFGIERPSARGDWAALEIEFHDVSGCHEPRSNRPRQQIPIWVAGVPRTLTCPYPSKIS